MASGRRPREMDWASRKPPRARRVAYSSVVRSRPPTLTSISRSEKNRERLAGIRGEVSLHEEDTRTGRHRATAVREDGNRLIVLEARHDAAQDVGVAARGHRVEEAPSDELAAVDHACRVEDLPSVLDDVRLVEEDAAQVRVPLEDRRRAAGRVRPRHRPPGSSGRSRSRGDEARVGGELPLMAALNTLATSGCPAR